MDTLNPIPADKLAELQTQIKGFQTYSWRKHNLHFCLNVFIILTGIGLSAGVTLAGATGEGLKAGIMGALISCLFGIQNAFKFAEKAHFWQVRHSEAKDLRDRLNYKTHTERDFQSVVDAWLDLRKVLLDTMPRATGLEAPKTPDPIKHIRGDNGGSQ